MARRHAYCDTFRVWLPKHLPGRVQRSLEQIDPRMNYHGAPENKRFYARVAGRSALYVARLTFQRLDERIVAILEEQFPTGTAQPLVNAVHLALDLAGPTPEAAGQLQQFLDRSLLKRGHRCEQRVTRFKNTQYIGDRGGRTVVAMYSDKPDRHKGGPCCHVEFRLQGRSVLRARGIHRLRDLLTFDHRRFWKSYLKLNRIDTRALGQRLNRRHLASGPQIKRYGSFTHDADLFSAHVWLRHLAYQEQRAWNEAMTMPSVSAVAAELRRYDLSRRGVLQQMDASPYLPMTQGGQ